MDVISMFDRSAKKIKDDNNKGSLREKPVTIKVERSIYEKVSSYVSEGKIRDFVNETLLMNVERLHIMDRYHAPFLTLVSISASSLFVKDTKLDKIVEVKLYEKRDNTFILKCSYEERENADTCVHVAYCMGVLELGKLRLIDNS